MISPVKLFAGVCVSDTSLLSQIEHRLEREFGPIDFRSDVIAGDRMLLSFEQLIDPGQFSEITLRIGSLMIEFTTGAVRIFPGYIENTKVVQPDTGGFRSEEFFTAVRHIYRSQLRTMCLIKRDKQ